jgi:fluoroquinolone resistance protein
MSIPLFIDQTICQNDSLEKGEYENCLIEGCELSEYNLSGFKFIDCTFKMCNMSLGKLTNTVFRDVQFIECKMLGLRFEDCNDFGLSFTFVSCQMTHSSFYKLKLKKTIFQYCQLHGVDFTETDLSGACFDDCELNDAVFMQTNLESSDFRTASGFEIDPELNRIKSAKFSLYGIPGLLLKYRIEIEK